MSQPQPNSAMYVRHGASELPIYASNPEGDTAAIDEMVADALHSMREHLDMDVSFVSRFTSGRRFFEYVSTRADNASVCSGGSDPLEETYCQRVVDGRLPQLITDASQIPEAAALPVTASLPVGAHLSVPIRFSDGSIYGTFCCFSVKPDYTLTDRDVAVMRQLANVIGRQFERHAARARERNQIEARMRDVLDSGSFSSVYQPIVHLGDDRLVGFEALTRFHAEPQRSPDQWFREAAECNLQATLEFAAMALALGALARLPAKIYVTVNISPATVLSGGLERALEGYPLHRIVLEITEHASVHDYTDIIAELAPLRRQGLWLAVDDAGAGFASFRHILVLRPDMIKLDRTLIRDIDTDAGRRALAVALIHFGAETGSQVIAEGVETEAELHVLRNLGVTKAQGYLLGHPAPIEKAIERSGEESRAASKRG